VFGGGGKPAVPQTRNSRLIKQREFFSNVFPSLFIRKKTVETKLAQSQDKLFYYSEQVIVAETGNPKSFNQMNEPEKL
jgi:hypothetical protein